MTYEEFEKLVTELTDNLPYSSYRDTFNIIDGAIVQRHESGGAAGGNCWGDSAKHFHNSRDPDDFLPLDSILKEVVPDVSYLKYKEIEKLIEEGSDSDYEYYGNYTEYNTYTLDIRKLYDKLFS